MYRAYTFPPIIHLWERLSNNTTKKIFNKDKNGYETAVKKLFFFFTYKLIFMPKSKKCNRKGNIVLFNPLNNKNVIRHGRLSSRNTSEKSSKMHKIV